MTKRKKIALGCAALATVVLVYQLFPLSSARHAIVFDDEQIARKDAYLADVAQAKSPDTNRPNVIIILADDLGKTDISHYGGQTVKTPNIDGIGERGMTFTDAYCTSPICSPSRASLLTGRYQQRFGFETQPLNRYPRNRLEYNVYRHFMDMGNWRPQDLESVPRQEDMDRQGLPPSELTLAELLQSNGYSTGLIGKWHLGFTKPFQPTVRGFDESYGFYEAFTLYDDIDDPDIVNHRHDYFASKHIWAQERNGTCAIRRNEVVIEEDEYLTFAIAREARQYMKDNQSNPFFMFVSFSAPHTPFQAPKSYYNRFAHVEDSNKRVYYSMIAALDDAVGQIMQSLDDLDLTQNTVVWFASDNGGATYTGATENAPLKGGKFNHFEGGINIPCMVQWPGTIPGGGRMTDSVTLMDIFNTSAAVAQASLPSDIEYDGVDLMPQLTGASTSPPHEALFWRSHHMKAARWHEWKLIVDTRDERTWLYNLAVDKEERTNEAENRPVIVQDIKRRLAEWELNLAPARWPYLVEYRFEIDGETYDYPL
jgi:arylsulfatase A-like enzyme